jgi:hypothetical protein
MAGILANTQGRRHYYGTIRWLAREKRPIIDYACGFSVNEIAIEDKGSGTALIQDLRNESIAGVPYPIAFVPDTDKVTRMHDPKYGPGSAKAAIRAHLEKLISLNKTRTDFREKFEELIESYNAGSLNIEDLFNQLISMRAIQKKT